MPGCLASETGPENNEAPHSKDSAAIVITLWKNNFNQGKCSRYTGQGKKMEQQKEYVQDSLGGNTHTRTC